jgi:hypothetical protein
MFIKETVKIAENRNMPEEWEYEELALEPEN